MPIENDVQLAQACQALYASIAPAAAGGISYEVTGSTIVCRGSQSADDWLADFDAIPFWTPLGFVHMGFWLGMPALFDAVKGIPNPTITGHSLGGAHARVLAGLFCLAGLPVAELVTFASPRPAFPNLQRVIEKSGIVHRSYRFHNDPVPLVPFPLALMPWTHTEEWIALDGTTEPENLDPLRDHSITNYIDMLTVLPMLPALCAKTSEHQ